LLSRKKLLLRRYTLVYHGVATTLVSCRTYNNFLLHLLNILLYRCMSTDRFTVNHLINEYCTGITLHRFGYGYIFSVIPPFQSQITMGRTQIHSWTNSWDSIVCVLLNFLRHDNFYYIFSYIHQYRAPKKISRRLEADQRIQLLKKKTALTEICLYIKPPCLYACLFMGSQSFLFFLPRRVIIA